MRRASIFFFVLMMLGTIVLIAEPTPKTTAPANAAVSRTEPSVAEGERRYRANCSRCHQAPPKFAPAAMGTVIRHMRVRAMITDEDMHAILKFMTQ